MRNKDYMTAPEFARILGISRIAVYKKIKKGQIEAVRIGRNYAIPKKYLEEIKGRALSDRDKAIISRAVKRTFKDYGEVIKLLGKE